MSDHPCVSRRLRKEKGTFVIIGFVKWKEKTWAQAQQQQQEEQQEQQEQQEQPQPPPPQQ